MEPRSLKFIATACAGEQVSGSPETRVCRVCTDSRQVQPEDLFVALEGEKFDGHGFLAEVTSRGAVAALVRRAKIPDHWNGCALIAVEDTRPALGRLAARYRREFVLPTIAVGGSNGKTTTKELLAAVLGEGLRTLASPASFNNDIGVPLTLLKLEKTHQAAVLEVGTNHPGELAPLVKLIRPQYGVITSLGREHLEFFGDLKGVAAEEGQLAEWLPAKGKLFINGDCPELLQIGRRTKAKVVRVGFASGNDWRVRDIRMDENGMRFQVDGPAGDYSGEYELRLLGRHQSVNALLAIAVGRELGLNRAQIRAGLAQCSAPKMRLQLWTVRDVRVLDDSYNANADSMRAALETLRDFPCSGRRIAVLGEMAELGAHSFEAHAEVGRHAAETGVGHLFAVGNMASVTGRAAREGGLNAVQEFPDVAAAASAVRDFVQSGDIVLLKASRASRLERIGDALRTLAT